MATAVFFHAHPDDETILTGGTIARLVQAGHRVVLVVATRGEHGEVPPGLLLPGQELAHRRTAETLWAADVLGIHRVEFLGYCDSGMAGTATNALPEAFCNADVEEAASKLAALLREEDAEVLTIYDDHGGYGHPDHVQVHTVGLRAAELVPDVAVFEATMNRDHLRRGLELLRATGGASAPDVPDLGEAFGESEDKITHAVDVAGELDRKRRAMAAHASQIAETSFFLSLPEPAFVAGFGTEWFISRRDPSGGRTTLDDLASSAPAPT